MFEIYNEEENHERDERNKQKYHSHFSIRGSENSF